VAFNSQSSTHLFPWEPKTCDSCNTNKGISSPFIEFKGLIQKKTIKDWLFGASHGSRGYKKIFGRLKTKKVAIQHAPTQGWSESVLSLKKQTRGMIHPTLSFIYLKPFKIFLIVPFGLKHQTRAPQY